MDFYNENEFRDYPFVPRFLATDLPRDAIVDFGAILGPESEAVAADIVYLHAIRREGRDLSFDFRTTAAPSVRCLFHRDIGAPEFTVDWQDADAVADSSSSAAAGSPLWQAFLVTGRFSKLLELLPGDGALNFGDAWKIEPARVQNMAGARVTKLSVANTARNLVDSPAGCEGSASSSAGAASLIAQVRGLVGSLKIKEGYNASVRQEDLNNAFVISASAGGGEGKPCGEIPRYPGETPAADSPFLSGGPACNALIKAINGVGGRHVGLRGGQGVLVFPSPDEPHTIVIRFLPDAFWRG